MGQDAQSNNGYRNVIIQAILALIAIGVCLFIYSSLSGGRLLGTGADTPTSVAIAATTEATMEATEPIAEATPEVFPTDTATIRPTPTFIILPILLTPIIGLPTDVTPEMFSTDVPTIVPTPNPNAEQTQTVIDSIVERTLTAFASIPTPTVPTSVAHIDSIPAVNGEVDPSAPSKLALGEVSAIRVEIRMNLVAIASEDGTPVYIPTESPTPRLGTPQPTTTFLPTIAPQYTEITECMEAELTGVSLNNFEIDPSPQRTMRQFKFDSTPTVLQVAWWQWSIRTKGDQALGVNKFAIQIYHGQKINGECKSTAGNPANRIDVEIEVYRTESQTIDSIWQTIVKLATAIVPIGTVISLLYGLYKFLQARREKNNSTGGN